jgi:heptose I phosphotransferase
MYLTPKLQKHLEAQTKQPFAYFMSLQGERFREQDGRRTQRVILDQQSYFIKQHHGVGWLEIFKNLLQGKWPILGAKNEWLALKRLQDLGLAAPSLAAYGSLGRNPAKQQSFILMEELTQITSLEDYCRDWATHPPAFTEKLSLLKKVAHIAKTLHEHGINHRDFYLCHFLLHGPSQKLFLIDLHRAGIHKVLRTRWIIKDLAGLYFSAKELGLTSRDLLRFIKLYRGARLRDTLQNEKNFWRQVIKRGDKLYASCA